MLKAFVSWMLIFLLSVNIGCVTILKTAYEANISYFVDNFCVNKEKPKMKCNGKCHLKKTISKLTNSSIEAKKNIIPINISIEFINTPQNIIFKPTAFFLYITRFFLQSSYNFSFIRSLTKPPSSK